MPLSRTAERPFPLTQILRRSIFTFTTADEPNSVELLQRSCYAVGWLKSREQTDPMTIHHLADRHARRMCSAGAGRAVMKTDTSRNYRYARIQNRGTADQSVARESPLYSKCYNIICVILIRRPRAFYESTLYCEPSRRGEERRRKICS